MYKDRTILGIIPARGGSKGLPGKNVRELSGKPLIAWSIERALTSKFIDKVIVTTDDSEIEEISKQYGAEVPFTRPAYLAGDTTSMLDVVLHATDFYKDRNITFDYIALLEPTSPLRKEGDIDSAIEELIDHEEEADGLVSVGEVHLEHPSIMKGIDGGYVRPIEISTENVTRRQDLDKVFFPYGVIYLVKTEKLIANKTFYQERTIPYFIERWQNYEVDDVYDFVCIEAVMNHEMEGSVK